MASVDSSRAKEKLTALMQRMRSAGEAALKVAGQNIAEAASARAPSPEEEFETMMYGEGNPYGVDQDVSPQQVADAGSDGDGRVRFAKPAGTYLREWLQKDFHPDGLFVGIGYKPDLESISSYSWKNRGGTYASDGFFMAWEHGGTFTVRPRWTGRKGNPYPLLPSLAKHIPPLFEMVKTIPRKQMFGSVDLEAEVDKVIIPAIKEAARKAQ